jgi:hypothetical protein
MSERIKQLMQQAGTDTSGKWMGVDRAEKFAELIVRECGQWVNDNLGLLDEEARADLLKHFGVEESSDE